MFSRTLAVGLAALAGFSALAAQPPGGTAARDNKAALTPESFPALHALVRPQEHEWRHLQVEWLTDVVAARRRAATEDKPLVVLYTGGAGYNEPLGVC